MSFKNFLTEASGDVWLYAIYFGDDDDLDMESLTVFASEGAVAKAMIEEIENCCDEGDENPALKQLKKLKTIDAVKKFIRANIDELGGSALGPFAEEDVFCIRKTTIRK